MTTQKQIDAAYDALEAFLTQTLWSEQERNAMKAAVMHAILIIRRKRRRTK